MIVYEVNLRIDNSVAEEFAVWLRGHILGMLEIDGFHRAVWYYEEPEGAEQRWSVQYHVSGWNKLKGYLDEQAGSMRNAAKKRFGERFSATRRVLMERETFK